MSPWFLLDKKQDEFLAQSKHSGKQNKKQVPSLPGTILRNPAVTNYSILLAGPTFS